jgi:hypothetical protein
MTRRKCNSVGSNISFLRENKFLLFQECVFCDSDFLDGIFHPITICHVVILLLLLLLLQYL